MMEFFEIEGSVEKTPAIEVPEPKKRGLFDYIDNINTGRTRLIVGKEYLPFLANRAMMQHQDTVFVANALNRLGIQDAQAHYDFLFYSVPKRKRFGKWSKEEKHDFEEVLDYIQEKWCYNKKTAIEMYHQLDDSEIELLKKEFVYGKETKNDY